MVMSMVSSAAAPRCAADAHAGDRRDDKPASEEAKINSHWILLFASPLASDGPLRLARLPRRERAGDAGFAFIYRPNGVNKRLTD